MPAPSADQPENFLPLHPFDLRILLVLAEGPAHGYPIIKVIEETDGSYRPAHRATRIDPAGALRAED